MFNWRGKPAAAYVRVTELNRTRCNRCRARMHPALMSRPPFPPSLSLSSLPPRERYSSRSCDSPWRHTHTHERGSDQFSSGRTQRTKQTFFIAPRAKLCASGVLTLWLTSNCARGKCFPQDSVTNRDRACKNAPSNCDFTLLSRVI